MKIDEILSDLRWREQYVDSSMASLNDEYASRKAFGYDDERLDKLIELAEDLVDSLKELKKFRDTDLTKKETGA